MKIRKSMENIAGTIDRYDYYRDCVEYADPLFGVGCATWQGKELCECKLTHSQILEGGELHFVMGDKPSMWARTN